MHVVSVCLHYLLVSPNIIWLSWQRTLTNRKITYRSIICTQSAHMVKRLRKSVQYIQRYSTKYAGFLAVSYQTFTNELCQLLSYWMSCGWEGNRRSVVALAMHHRLKWFIHLRAQGLSKADKHHVYIPQSMVLFIFNTLFRSVQFRTGEIKWDEWRVWSGVIEG